MSEGAYPLSQEASDDYIAQSSGDRTLRADERQAYVKPDDLDKERNRGSLFRHPPIDFNRQQIRLVKILKTGPDALIKCKFAIGMVDEKSVRYTALSYTWGSASKDSYVVRIILHKQDFCVRRHLWCFLRQARDDPALRANWYWIDALCIDQAENGSNGHQEKNHQVNMMSRIYSNAHKVMAWLGEPAPEEYAALDALQNCCDARASKKHEKLTRQGLRYLGNSSYWLRIWIIQELVLATDVSFRSGHHEFHWDDIYKMRSSAYQPHTWCVQDFGWAMTNILDLRHDWSRGITLDLVAGLRDFHSQKCSDPRDKIYGLLGLMRHKPCRADYSKSGADLYEELVLWALDCKLLSLPIRFSRPNPAGAFCNGTSPSSPCRTLDLWSATLGLSASEVWQTHSRLADELQDNWPPIHPLTSSCGAKWRYHFTI